jgi:hypothetical protein
MKSKAFAFAVRIVAVPVLAVSIGALAQTWTCDKLPQSYKGQINAYTPAPLGSKAPFGPYEIRGPWSLILKRGGTKADFSTELNMILSDGWVLTNGVTPPDFDPKTRNAHTHHITMTDADVTILATGGFQVVGTATVTLNGGPTPFVQQAAMTTIVITGGTDVEFSNFSLTFPSTAPASGHFGTLPLPGVVQKVERENGRR